MGPTLVIRPRGAQVLGALMVGIAAVTAVATALDGLDGIWSFGAPIALFGLFGWAAFWRPRVEVSDGGVTVVNTLRTVQVPWPAVRGVDGRYGLRLDTEYGVVRAWGAAAPAGAQRARQEQGPAAVAVLERMEALGEAGHLDQPRLETAGLPHRWHRGVLVAAGALCVLGVVLPLFG